MPRSLPLTLALLGCANLTPGDLRELEPFRYTLKNSPNEAALCVRNNVESQDGAWSAEFRGNEVFVRIQGQVMGIVELSASGAGSNAVLYIGRTYPKAEVAERYIKGC